MLRRGLVLDLSVALGTSKTADNGSEKLPLRYGTPANGITGLGVTAGYAFWYGYHVPAVRQRDVFYEKLENERAKATGSG
jgi:hypothetical protein